MWQDDDHQTLGKSILTPAFVAGGLMAFAQLGVEARCAVRLRCGLGSQRSVRDAARLCGHRFPARLVWALEAITDPPHHWERRVPPKD